MNRNKLGVVLEWKYSDYIEWTVGVGKKSGNVGRRNCQHKRKASVLKGRNKKSKRKN